MSEEVIKVLDYISEKLGVAIDWTTENALPYVEEVVGKFITYNIVYNSVGLLIGILLFIISCVIFKKVNDSKIKYLKTKENNFYWEKYYGNPSLTDFGLFIVFGCGMLIVFGIITIGVNGSELMKWSIVPEIALLKEIQHMLG